MSQSDRKINKKVSNAERLKDVSLISKITLTKKGKSKET